MGRRFGGARAWNDTSLVQIPGDSLLIILPQTPGAEPLYHRIHKASRGYVYPGLMCSYTVQR